VRQKGERTCKLCVDLYHCNDWPAGVFLCCAVEGKHRGHFLSNQHPACRYYESNEERAQAINAALASSRGPRRKRRKR